MFFEKAGPLWDTLNALEKRLSANEIPYVIIGGLALTAHKYNRQTIDIDIVVRPRDFEEFKTRVAGAAYVPAPGAPRRFRDTATEVDVDFLIAGELAGHRGKNRVVRFPDPSEAEVHAEIPTVSLARLIELKLVTWRFKDWGDVVELIRRNDLSEDFAEQLNPLVRRAYCECYDQMVEDRRYEAEG